jgi:hypothetical protein
MGVDLKRGYCYFTDDLGQGLCIGNVPGRKQPALYLRTKGNLEILAYFTGDEQAMTTINLIEGMIKPILIGEGYDDDDR